MSLFNEIESTGKTAASFEPLATRMRPKSVEEYVGQDHLLGKGKLLRRAIESKMIGSMVFHGPPSSGKTTLALVIASEMDAKFITLNAVLDGVKELRNAVSLAGQHQSAFGKPTILFVDEIHRWNKAQQDALLPHIESGLLTLIGATTENPYYSLVGPLLSRCQMFELEPFSVEDISLLLQRALNDKERGLASFNVKIDDDALEHFAEYAGGDIRNALNALDMATRTLGPEKDGFRHITLDVALESIQKRVVRYDGTGDEHYHYISAFIKSMRGSDVDAALYWMAAMLEGGEDPMFLFRRMLIFASEDVGMADSFALSFTISAQDAFERTGMPEGLYYLAHACIYLSMAPKSNSTKAIFKVVSEIKSRGVGKIPPHLKDKTASGKQSKYTGQENASKEYKYPHDHANNWVKQQYLPDEAGKKVWFEPGNQGRERSLWDRLKQIKGES
ncbi:MAG: replication-associated recombination protein A [Balneolales bacterium]|nr:replication-associated recombination protein A [Balneolales bacterium]